MAANRLRKWGLVVPALFAVAACGESGTAPTRSVARPARPEEILGIALNNPGDTVTTDFVYVPSTGTTLSFGFGSKVIMPAGSVCDPMTSTYGPTEWDKPCVAADAPITIHMKIWMDENMNPAVDFSPALRFVPTTDMRQYVQIALMDPEASDEVRARWLNIQYASAPGADPVDEAAYDLTLRTKYNTAASIVWRRVKHFSGYNIPADRSGVPAVAAELTELGASVLPELP